MLRFLLIVFVGISAFVYFDRLLARNVGNPFFSTRAEVLKIVEEYANDIREGKIDWSQRSGLNACRIKRSLLIYKHQICVKIRARVVRLGPASIIYHDPSPLISLLPKRSYYRESIFGQIIGKIDSEGSATLSSTMNILDKE